MELNLTGFASPIVSAALQQIKDEGFNVIRCSLTGWPVGHIDDSEINLVLNMEVHRKPLSSVDDLVDSFGLCHYAYSSGPAPSLRIHRDHSSLVRIMHLDSNGPSRLLSYLTGRLLFESIVPEREINSTDVRRARLAFLSDMNKRLTFLDNWHESLTADDELGKTADNAIATLTLILSYAEWATPDQDREAKAAQRCLEALLRLDAIHNLRTHFYNTELKAQLVAMRDSDYWTFTAFDRLLKDVESDGLIRIGYQKPVGNAMSLTAALASLDISRRRTGFALQEYMKHMEKDKNQARLHTITGVGSEGAALMNQINELLVLNQREGGLSGSDERNLVSVLKQLQRGVDGVSMADKRLTALHRRATLDMNRKGKHQVVHAPSVTKHLMESYRDAGVTIPAALQTKFDALVDAGKLNPSVKKAPNTANGQMLANLFKSSMIGNLPDISGITKPGKE